LPSGSTDYQKAQYLRAGRQYRSTVRRARAALGQRQEALLAVWARSAIAHLNARTLRSAPHAISMQAALATVAADFASLHEAGIDANSHSVIAVINPPAAAIATGPALSPELQDVSIVVSSFTGSSTAQTAWQNGLLQAGAGRVVLLTPATQGQLPPVVRQGLDGAVTDTLTSVLFASGKYRLQHGALPQLRRLQRLLTVTYPTATVSINGYTDNVPARIPGGNPELSRLRAQAVEAWLAGHGLTASRMQATSNGDADPLAPNTPRGQPLNRRVVVVIDPSTTK
jgi:outer membrane protein OmpA-like peptidoglycan-associated protein